ncbi:hypothetical protein FUAX_10870 [Fulvitalea axinellae]|uniref:Uncharacterized protein n=1 Tax=Fulvitalea axinellae TaxID=1182444 RepID=A0AAU9D8Q6_9BACT|nr:hypothetical protein FUAX_10870 [Fulvitalea axinellae]
MMDFYGIYNKIVPAQLNYTLTTKPNTTWH